VSAVLRAADGPAQPAAGAVLPIAAARIPSKGSTRSVAWRAADSLAVRRFVGLGLDVAAPDHSTISRTRRLIAVEAHRAVFTWVQERLVTAGLLTGRTVAIDATALEANAAMRSIVRRTPVSATRSS
jgi:transposase